MSSDQDILADLRQLDQQEFALTDEIERRPKQLRAELERVERAEAEVAKAREAVKDLQRLVDRRNLDLRTAEEHEKKLQSQLMTLKNNDDYKAMLRQIDQEKTRIGDLELKVLEGMEVLDRARADIPERERALAAERKDLEAKRDVVQGEIKELEQDRSAIQADWSKKVIGLTEEIRSTYERMRPRMKAKTIVPVTAGSNCGGCHVSLTVNVVNALHAGSVKVCPHCQRVVIACD